MRILAWMMALVGLFFIIAFGVSYNFIEGELPLLVKLTGGVGAALLVAGIGLSWKSLAELGQDQSTGRSVNAIVATLLGLAIAVTGNVAVHKSNTRWDITKNKQYTLSQQSIDLVSKLDREIQLQAFFPASSPDAKNLKELLSRYNEHTTQLKVEFHDPYEEPLLAEKMKITSDMGTVVMSAGEKEKRIEYTFDESAITNALVQVTSDKTHKICSVTGHGELDVNDDSTVGGLGAAKQKLEGQNYKVESISLTSNPPSPINCEVVILAAPQSDLSPGELDRLAEYVAAGGSLIALLDFPLVPLNTVNDFARYGIKPGNDVVVENDPYRQFQNVFGLVLDSTAYEKHPLTEKLRGNSILFMSRSIDKGPEIPGLDVQILARTSESSWGETDYGDPNGALEGTPGRDLIGKVPVMAVVEVKDPANLRTHTEISLPETPGMPPAAPATTPSSLPTQPGGKVMVVGDADFATNQLVYNGLNQDLLLNTIAWMVGEDAQISIRSNEASRGKLEMTPIGLILVWLTSILFVPGAMVMGAVATWLYRRKL
jgi:hypothetical protein